MDFPYNSRIILYLNKLKVSEKEIELKNVRVHNLKGVDLTLPAGELIAFSGVSGSGKSSLAFDTLYREGQRRYVESLSLFARRQMGEMAKPELDHASGITPTLSIEQKSAGKNPRSTVGTMTEVYDFMRVLFARVSTPHCPVSKEAVLPQSRERIIQTIQTLPENTPLIFLAPLARGKKGEFKEELQGYLRKGFTRVRVDGEIVELDAIPDLDKNLAHDIDLVIDRLKLSKEEFSRVAEAATLALEMGSGTMSILTPEEILFSQHAYSPKSGLSYPALEPNDFSFNSPIGMCPVCQGLGITQEFDLDLVIDPELSISEDCCTVASSYQTVRFGNIYDNLARIYNFSVKTPWKKLSEEAKKAFLYGTEKKWTKMVFVHPDTLQSWVDHVQWRGVLYEAKKRYVEAKSQTYRKNIEELMHEAICPSCQGSRLKPYPSEATLGGKKIFEIANMTIEEAAQFFHALKLTETEAIIADELLKEIKERLFFLENVGLSYLTLDRTAPTLSGGESQRVRLASQIGSGLVGITYILDEPSIGLHARDNKKLIATLRELQGRGNTVIVVEHDEETLVEADRIVDFGPGPGKHGGEILYNGDLAGLLQHKESLTGGYLSGRLKIPVPKKRRLKKTSSIEIQGAEHHNLKKIDVKIPLEKFVVITGVSGSGKSSLILETLYPALTNLFHQGELKVGKHKEIKGVDKIDKVIAIDQQPIGRTPRSNPATYTKVFDEIRSLLSRLPESEAKGFKPGRFSFNVKEGSCSECGGMGMIKIDMDFMEDAWIDCPNCLGQRFDSDTLSVLYKGKNVHDILEMDIEAALEFFHPIPSIRKKLETLNNVGLGYLKLGQSSTTLSGGEAQRIKLAKELSRPATGKTLYILDEPTTGLHFHDVKHLIEVLQNLVEKGNSVVIIEHNMDVIKVADHLIDIGPEGGGGGGRVIAEGTPEKIAEEKSPTGIALKSALYPEPIQPKKLKTKASEPVRLEVENAEQNNLKRVSISLPRDQTIVFTGPSGSGKTSLAFETFYAEGQRRYIESLSPYARQFVKQMPKPIVGRVGGLSPAIAIEQKGHAGNPRSTVGTMTEIYDYLRILWAKEGIPHDPVTGEVIQSITKEYVVDKLLELDEGTRLQILAPIELKKGEPFEKVKASLSKQGYVRIRLNGEFYDLDSEIPYDRRRKSQLELVIDRLVCDKENKLRLFEAVETAAHIGNNTLIALAGEKELFFNLSFTALGSGTSFKAITPETFMFNKNEGMCPACQGIGTLYGATLGSNEAFLDLSAFTFLRMVWDEPPKSKAFQLFHEIMKEAGIDIHIPMRELPPQKLKQLLYGVDKAEKSPLNLRWIGFSNAIETAGRKGNWELKKILLPLLEERVCDTCQGDRLNAVARHVTIDKLSIADFCRLPVERALEFIKGYKIPKKHAVLNEVKDEIVSKLSFLDDVGLSYIELERKAPTLSGGEAQRIRLARQLGSGLTGVLYVLDEPTIGLHPYDNDRLNASLKKLKALGNTLLMVEHDPLTLKTADYIVDFGPGAGDHGGKIMAQGTYDEIVKNPNSLTGRYLSGELKLPIPEKRRDLNLSLIVEKGSCHNLKNFSCKIPLGALTTLTGVSGSGKSTLMHDILLPAVKKGLKHHDTVKLPTGTVSGIDAFESLIVLDQDPIGQTIRSDVSTYTDVLTPLRDFFSQLPAARAKGLMPKNFSSNHRKGMCTNCWGLGFKKIEMHFLPPIKIVCDACHGLRLNPVSLEVKYEGKNLGEYLNVTVDEAFEVFQSHPKIKRILGTLRDVGLGYLRLGQEIQTLSGGEAQRIKLSRELAKRSHGKTLYLLDEPTVGLHPDDIKKLIDVLNKLVNKGNTIILIEHNTDLIEHSDYLIDLGPGAGVHGGKLIAQGRPEEIAKSKNSLTGKYLFNS